VVHSRPPFLGSASTEIGSLIGMRWELRNAAARHQVKVQQARGLLAPVCGRFTEGFDTHDLKEAKALLEELAI
jgi:predicted ATPase